MLSVPRTGKECLHHGEKNRKVRRAIALKGTTSSSSWGNAYTSTWPRTNGTKKEGEEIGREDGRSRGGNQKNKGSDWKGVRNKIERGKERERRKEKSQGRGWKGNSPQLTEPQ